MAPEGQELITAGTAWQQGAGMVTAAARQSKLQVGKPFYHQNQPAVMDSSSQGHTS